MISSRCAAVFYIRPQSKHRHQRLPTTEQNELKEELARWVRWVAAGGEVSTIALTLHARQEKAKDTIKSGETSGRAFAAI